jgi:hypothetical protein
MARQPADPSHLAPVELLEFHREDWEQPGDGRFDPLHRWKQARAQFLEDHPGSLALGDVMHRFKTEFHAQYSPEHYAADATEWDDSAKAKPGKYGQYLHKPRPQKQSRKKRKR